MTLGEKINAANAEALEDHSGRSAYPDRRWHCRRRHSRYDQKTILHSGPPVTWENMCDPHQGCCYRRSDL